MRRPRCGGIQQTTVIGEKVAHYSGRPVVVVGAFASPLDVEADPFVDRLPNHGISKSTAGKKC
jgi:hypothetical protein